MLLIIWRFGLTGCILLIAFTVSAEEIRVAAASDLSFAMREIVPLFEKQTGNKIALTFGSSGNFYSQIQNGAPFDLYLSADSEYPQKLMQSGKAFGIRQYARGQLVLWWRSDVGPLNDLQSLSADSIHKIAIANPEHAPYGKAAVAALHHYGMYDRVKQKIVYGENVAQAMHFVQSGAADAGILPMSLAVAPSVQTQGKFWKIPAGSYAAIEQSGVIISASTHRQTAQLFMSFLGSEQVRSILQRYGFL